jgi:hypothetical protein
MRILILLFFLAIGSAAHAQDNYAKPEGTYFVLAPSGLNLREGPTIRDKKILRVPYGAQLELLQPAKATKLQVDNIPGGMAMVRYGDTLGFVFDGYLSTFPAPSKSEGTEAYAELVREQGIDCLYELHRKDWGGYINHEEAVTLLLHEWTEAFLIAQQLYDIPEGITFPGYRGPEKEIIENPEKPDYAWNDVLFVYRDEAGNLESMNYSFRAEGSGMEVVIRRSQDTDGLRISQALIAD